MQHRAHREQRTHVSSRRASARIQSTTHLAHKTHTRRTQTQLARALRSSATHIASRDPHKEREHARAMRVACAKICTHQMRTEHGRLTKAYATCEALGFFWAAPQYSKKDANIDERSLGVSLCYIICGYCQNSLRLKYMLPMLL